MENNENERAPHHRHGEHERRRRQDHQHHRHGHRPDQARQEGRGQGHRPAGQRDALGGQGQNRGRAVAVRRAGRQPVHRHAAGRPETWVLIDTLPAIGPARWDAEHPGGPRHHARPARPRPAWRPPRAIDRPSSVLLTQTRAEHRRVEERRAVLSTTTSPGSMRPSVQGGAAQVERIDACRPRADTASSPTNSLKPSTESNRKGCGNETMPDKKQLRAGSAALRIVEAVSNTKEETR